VAARAIVAAGEREELAARHFHRDVARHLRHRDTVDWQEGEAGCADHDLVARFEAVRGHLGAVDQRALLGNERERAVAQLDQTVVARHRRITEVHEARLVAPDLTPAHRELEFAARVGTFDDDESRQRHAVILV
jgi:hypothetical protein